MIFSNPEMREGFVELYGTDKPGAKYRIGDVVIFRATLAGEPAEWVGRVEAVNFAEEMYEYLIENAHVLAWESQLTAVGVVHV